MKKNVECKYLQGPVITEHLVAFLELATVTPSKLRL